MIARFKFSKIALKVDDTDACEISLTLCPAAAARVRARLAAIRDQLKKSGECVAKVEKVSRNRSVEQNALLWALLTIYADEEGETPEEVYYRMLDKYGAATFVTVLDEAVPALRSAFRDVKVIDSVFVVRNGKQTPAKLVKCTTGSSKYSVKEMSKLIDGVFAELAKMGVTGENNALLFSKSEEWRELRKES